MFMPMRSLTLILLVPVITGCSTIKSYFPDKEKDYRFTAEIPELVIPEDLKQSPVVDAATPLAPNPSVQESPAKVSDSAKPATVASGKPADAMQNSLPDLRQPVNEKDYTTDVDLTELPENTEAKLIHTAGGAALLQVNQTLSRSWRIVSQALTRKSVEVTQRKVDEHYFLVQFEPVVKELKDDSIWDSLDFVFGPENNQEQEYRISLLAKDQQTDIQVSPVNQASCSNDQCVQLLTLLQQAITEVTQKK